MPLCTPIVRPKPAPLPEQELWFTESGACARFRQHTLHSHFQSIHSLSMQRAIGFEALLRARDAAGAPVAPPELFGQLSAAQRKSLDSLCHLLHLNNFQNQSDRDHWLFLNMTPEVFLEARHAPAGRTFGDKLAELDFPAHLVVVEVLEEAVRDTAEFESAIAFFREIGCLIALDDFGAGSSNFDRIWKIRPQIVKLDRSLIAQAAQEQRVRRILPQLVSLLHEAGAMVLVEGIETADEAYLALEADADFAQGYLFGRPHPLLGEKNAGRTAVNEIWKTFDAHWHLDRQSQKAALAPYQNAIGYASTLLAAGVPMPEACASFFELPDTCFCYLLDEHGRQIGVNLWGGRARPGADPRLTPLTDTRGARWSRRPYFRRALEGFGRVQVTRPYLSISSASLCVTISVGFRHQNRTLVLCGDVRWRQQSEQ